MLYKYEFKNFCSFYELNSFDMLASQTKVRNRFPNNFYKTKLGLSPLKTMVIVGENAGGKSNFIKSLNFFKSLFIDNKPISSIKNFINTNNLCSENLAECDSTQSFSIEVIIDNEIYIYNLVIDIFSIIEESLYIQKNKKAEKKLILHASRSKHNSQFNETKKSYKLQASYKFEAAISDEIKVPLEEAMKNTDKIGLFVNKLALLENKYSKKLINWINNDLFAENILINYDLYKDFQREEDDIRIIKEKKFIDILKMVDYSIVDIEIDDDRPFIKTIIKRKKVNGEFFSKELQNDSTGVREFFAWAVQIYRVVYENKTFFADEMDRVLNPILSDRIISFINGKAHTGQFILTTHNVLHLDLKKYMKEQIYFITKNKETLNSELYSLADFPEIRYETTKIHEFYMKGLLGGTSYE
jgi:AAA15 family ATPase/GTPase